jgi:DNA-binding Xre family transcriptional regulator
MLNQKLLEYLTRKDVSLYRISEATGIPYTTLSRLKLGKLDLNKCSAEAVNRLARFLECSSEDLLNPYPFMSGVHGTYKGYKYRWVSEGEDDVLYVKDNGSDVEIDRNAHVTSFRHRSAADTFTEMVIDIYIEKKEADALCKNIT